ncbi:RagB/SusD family nutrient uptake outer membrane protein [Spirosoma sp. KUDC1026]|uniref:RagB/SusD family nutrient uptake outer membrane protein n=1 Tax=Spirosoma sp. KUDC1026 TaxID=2745947 RepID=UPI00159B998F|nr:RagB/SusD family nutrient uptake outer membrane protein [Spirosoma sp. KUDC1026]QKZ11860.1 RagB/SusD family nutrient uptake outer membrane protein [Spirosoma sp. KUDC1026]
MIKFSGHQLSVFFGVTALLGVASCTNLDDAVFGQLSSAEGTANSVPLDPASTLQGAYQLLNNIATNQGNTYAMEEHPSDEMMGPTRGTDWDDFGRWRRLHQHTWDSQNDQILGAWNDLNSGVFRSTQALSVAGSDVQIAAQARFLRAFYMYHIVDLWGQVPFRNVTDSPESNPIVYNRVDGTNFVIRDLRYAFNNLTTTAANQATKEAAAAMLAKVYLNRAVYTNTTAPAGPYTFAKADMDSVTYFANQVIGSGKFALTTSGKYFDNFHWQNDSRSKELIFTINNTTTSQPGNVRNRYYMTLHYNQYVSAWNGFTTLADFYNSFEASDERRGGPVSDLTPSTGLNAGFLVGQQYVSTPGSSTAPSTIVAAKDRLGNPLVFTPQVNLSYATEDQGIRVVKYLPQPGAVDAPANDYVFLRYADVLLMKAEALLRGGSDTQGQTAAGIVNNLRTTRKASSLGTVDLTVLLAERGRELYWEGWRRSDQIRFGKFLDPVDQRPTASPATAVLFVLPQQAVDSNPNLIQNPGY